MLHDACRSKDPQIEKVRSVSQKSTAASDPSKEHNNAIAQAVRDRPLALLLLLLFSVLALRKK
jgi:hypothetical protein